jgi:glycosyltransferase involved in cell wall biosynthesis
MGTAVFATASLEAYGSDLQMMQSVIALHDSGWRVVVAAPASGRLNQRLRDLGAEVEQVDFPVLRRADASVKGMIRFTLAGLRSLPRMAKLIRGTHADLVYVNTVTLPWWLVAGRLLGVKTLCHVHEAEARDSRVVQLALTLPLLLAHLVIVNSKTTEEQTVGVLPALRRRSRRVYNGVEPPPSLPTPAEPSTSARLVVVSRLSPRKAPHVALEATALLKAEGRDVVLELCGSSPEGMEWYLEQLELRAQQPDLAGSVKFQGYTAPIWPAFADADVVIAPSLGESFGNAVVEGQLARRPVVATAIQGHLETVVDGVTGLLVPCEDPVALAAAVARLLDDPVLAVTLARQGRESAMASFTSGRYYAAIRRAVTDLVGN